MDLRLFALLLLCYCKQGWMQEDVAVKEDEIIPLIPLMPSKPISPAISHTATSTPTTEIGENSSEEDLDGLCGKHSRTPEIRQAVGTGIMKFGLQLLENLKANSEQPNVIISPLSVSLALSQLALGAKNETEELLLQRLHADTVPCYHKALKDLLHHVRKNALRIASRIYLGSGFQPKQEFMQESMKIYDSEPAILSELEEINEWVEKSTNGQVTDFLSSLPSNILMMLINAVHYKGEWLTRFDSRFTSSEPFYIEDSLVVNVDMMLGPKYPLSIFSHNELDAQVARFPFRGNMSLVIVMPMSGYVNVTAISAKLNISDLYSRFPRERSMQVKLPKFKIDFSQELDEALTSMGTLRKIFPAGLLQQLQSVIHFYSTVLKSERGGGAFLPSSKMYIVQFLQCQAQNSTNRGPLLPITGLGELFINPNLAGISEGPLVVSSVQHKSSMEINEEGAEAAAATSVIISRSNPSFTVNQPFFLALMDDSSQTPLFLGVISNPNPSGSAVISSPDDSDKTGMISDKDDAPSSGLPPK